MSRFQRDLAAGERLAALQVHYAVQAARRRERLNPIEKRVKAALAAGKSTGDPLRDTVIRAYGFWPEGLELFRKFEKRLKGKKGQLVLICYRVKNPSTMFPTREQLKFPTTGLFRLAVLGGETLRYDEELFPCVTIPTGGYIQGTWPQSDAFRATLEKNAEPVSLGLFRWQVSSFRDSPDRLECFLRQAKSSDKDDRRWYRIVIGDKDVRAAFKEIKSLNVLAAAAKKLSHAKR